MSASLKRFSNNSGPKTGNAASLEKENVMDKTVENFV
jgi:hypothetical protein